MNDRATYWLMVMAVCTVLQTGVLLVKVLGDLARWVFLPW